MPGQFDNETSVNNFEWHRERALKAKKSSDRESMNRMVYNLKAVESKHGAKAANELMRELNSKKVHK